MMSRGPQDMQDVILKDLQQKIGALDLLGEVCLTNLFPKWWWNFFMVMNPMGSTLKKITN